MNFKTWLKTFVSEKNLNLDHVFTVEGKTEFGDNHIPLAVVLDAIRMTSRDEQKGIKGMLIRIDFVNGNVMDYFGHLAKALAV